MKKHIFFIIKILFFITQFNFILINFIFAQDTYNLGNIVISANKIEQSKDDIANVVEIITNDEIEKSASNKITDILNNIKGINLSYTGISPTSQATISIRGASPGQTMVMIDGVEVKDIMEIAGGFYDFGLLTLENVERIEIIKGSQSVLYGSSAIGGIVNIITKKAKNKFNTEINLSASSHDTYFTAFSFSGKTKKTNYYFSASKNISNGFSIAQNANEKDNSNVENYSLNFFIDILKSSKLNIISHYNDSYTALDYWDFNTYSVLDDLNNYIKKKTFDTAISLENSFNKFWNNKFSVSFLNTKRDNFTLKDPMINYYTADVLDFAWQNNFLFLKNNTITLGFDYQNLKGSSFENYAGYISEISQKNLDLSAIYFQNEFNLNKKLFFIFGLRRDEHQVFGIDLNYKTSFSYLLFNYNTKLKINYASGFKAPSIYQLYSSYGDINLKPEHSKNYDFSIEQNIFNDLLFLEISYFNNYFEDLIDYDFTLNKYQNISKVKTDGFEGSLKTVIKNIEILLNYTYLTTLNEITNTELLNRPKNIFNFSFNYQPIEKFNFNFSINYKEGSQQKIAYNTIEKTNDYTIANIALTYKQNKTLSYFLKINNVFDINYYEVYSYKMPGAFYTLGLRKSF